MMKNNHNYSNFTIDTGTQRHVYGHAVSGGVAVGVVSCISNYTKVREKKIDKTEAARNTLKDVLIGSIATATAVSVANNLGNPQKSIFQTLGALALGAGAVYAIDKGSEQIKMTKENNEK